jgi:hypothetical protein
MYAGLLVKTRKGQPSGARSSSHTHKRGNQLFLIATLFLSKVQQSPSRADNLVKVSIKMNLLIRHPSDIHPPLIRHLIGHPL